MDNEMMKEVGKLQDDYKKLVDERKLTKRAMCELVIPFRDKYGLSDMQSLQIARAELTISEIAVLLEREAAYAD